MDRLPTPHHLFATSFSSLTSVKVAALEQVAPFKLVISKLVRLGNGHFGLYLAASFIVVGTGPTVAVQPNSFYFSARVSAFLQITLSMVSRSSRRETRFGKSCPYPRKSGSNVIRMR
jgi:hypothetical protein